MRLRGIVRVRGWWVAATLCALCAACAGAPAMPSGAAPGGTQPAGTETATSQADATQPAATAAASQILSPTETAPTASPSALPLTATPKPESARIISPANAVSVTQVAVLGPLVISGTGLVKLEQVAWSPGGQLAAAGAAGVLFARDGALTVTTGYTQSAWTLALDYSANGQQLATGSVDGSAAV